MLLKLEQKVECVLKKCNIPLVIGGSKDCYTASALAFLKKYIFIFFIKKILNWLIKITKLIFII